MACLSRTQEAQQPIVILVVLALLLLLPIGVFAPLLFLPAWQLLRLPEHAPDLVELRQRRDQQGERDAGLRPLLVDVAFPVG